MKVARKGTFIYYSFNIIFIFVYILVSVYIYNLDIFYAGYLLCCLLLQSENSYLKGVLAKIERGYWLTAKNNRF